MKSIIYQIVSTVAVGLYFVPLAIVITKKLWSQLAFRLFALYWFISALANLIEFIPISRKAAMVFTIIYNMMDMPLVLTVFYYVTTSLLIKKIVKISVPAILMVEVGCCILLGFKYESLKYTLGGSLLIVLAVIVAEIILKVQKIKITRTERALLLIYAAMLFEYGTYIVIYIFDYFLPGASSSTDNFFVYYLSSVIALTVAVCGFLTRGIGVPVIKQAGGFELDRQQSGGATRSVTHSPLTIHH